MAAEMSIIGRVGNEQSQVILLGRLPADVS